jgi:hypothetical protein
LSQLAPATRLRSYQWMSESAWLETGRSQFYHGAQSGAQSVLGRSWLTR